MSFWFKAAQLNPQVAAVASQPQVYQQQPTSAGPSTVSITPIQYQQPLNTDQQQQVVQQQHYQQVQQQQPQSLQIQQQQQIPLQQQQQQLIQQQTQQIVQPQPPAAHRSSSKSGRKPLQQVEQQGNNLVQQLSQVQTETTTKKGAKKRKNKKKEQQQQQQMQASSIAASQNVQSGNLQIQQIPQNQQMQQIAQLQPQQVQQQQMAQHIDQGGAIQVVTSYTGQSQYMIKRERVPASAVAALQSPSTVNFKLNLNKEDEDFAYGPNSEGELHEGCRKCNVVYGSATELKLHFSATHNRQTFECFVCNKLFLQKFAFLAHIDRYHDDCGKSFPCQFCDKSYTNQNALDQHIGTYHKNPHLICPLCSKSFPQKFSLRRHIQNVHENSGKGEDCKHPFKCLTCGKSYKSQSGLTIHSKSKHQNTQYKCELCNKFFSRASNVARHVDTIHNQSKTFPCKWCGKEFRSTGGRDMHITAEHKAIRYDCEICCKQFKRKGSLSRHLAGVHGQGELEVYKCDICSKEFKQKSHLKTHLKNLHGIESAPSRLPLYTTLEDENSERPTQVPPPSVITNFKAEQLTGNPQIDNSPPPTTFNTQHMYPQVKLETK